MNMKEDFNIEGLNEINKQAGFTAPEGYFDNLAVRIQDRIVKENQTAEKVSFWQLLKPQLAFASLILVFAFLTYSVYTLVVPEDEISRGLSAIHLELSDFEQIDIEEDIIVDAIISTEDTVRSKKEVKIELSDELMQYLLENNAEFPTLLEGY